MVGDNYTVRLMDEGFQPSIVNAASQGLGWLQFPSFLYIIKALTLSQYAEMNDN